MLALVAPLTLLLGCSPAITAVSAIGYDSDGRLIGAVKVCSGDVVEAHLAPAKEGAPDIAVWRRHSPISGTDSWALRAVRAGSWETDGPALPDLISSGEYVFWTQPKNKTSRSDFLWFRGSDLGRLPPGRVLIRRDGPTNSSGEITATVAVIPLAQLPREACGD
jgi:hypothetical protein